MHIYIYCCAIAIVCVLAIMLFVLKQRRDKKRYEEISKPQNDTTVAVEEDFDLTQEAQEVLEKQIEDAKLEDFSLEEKKEAKKPQFPFAPFGRRIFKDDKEENFDDDFGEDEDEMADDDEFADEKFEEYEEFLRKSLDLDDNQNDDFDEDLSVSADGDKDDREDKFSRYDDFLRNDNNDDDLNAIADFDFDSIKDKSENEIAEMIKNLPPRAQELLMSDILARRKFEDEQ